MTRYPTLSRNKTILFLARLRDGEDVSEEIVIKREWVGSGDDLAHALLDGCREELKSTWELQHTKPMYKRDRDRLEGMLSGPLHAALKQLDIEVLDDPGFWRYLSLAHFWWLVNWREPPGERKAERYLGYVDGSHPTECVLLRMYLRAQSVEFEGEYSLAGSLPDAADFWRSHVVRVRTGSAPEITRAFAQTQAAERMTTLPLRAFATRLNRMWTNIVMNTLDEKRAGHLIDELRD